MPIVWREQFRVGNDVIDEDHKYLIEIINSAEQGLMEKNQASLAVELGRLTVYAQEHFQREELIARAAGYEQSERLAESHHALVGKLAEIKAQIEADEDGFPPEAVHRFGELLRNWLIDHVIKEDLLMKPTMKKHSPLFDPRMNVRSS